MTTNSQTLINDVIDRAICAHATDWIRISDKKYVIKIQSLPQSNLGVTCPDCHEVGSCQFVKTSYSDRGQLDSYLFRCGICKSDLIVLEEV